MDNEFTPRREQLKKDIERLRHSGLILTADRANDQKMRVSRQDVIDRIVAGELPKGRYIIGGYQTRQIQ